MGHRAVALFMPAAIPLSTRPLLVTAKYSHDSTIIGSAQPGNAPDIPDAELDGPSYVRKEKLPAGREKKSGEYKCEKAAH
ncbi:hypothetical protein AE1304_35030 [Aeromonas enteropelogenes]